MNKHEILLFAGMPPPFTVSLWRSGEHDAIIDREAWDELSVASIYG